MRRQARRSTLVLDPMWWASDGPTAGYLAGLAMDLVHPRLSTLRVLDLYVLGRITPGPLTISTAMTARQGGGTSVCAITCLQSDPVAVMNLYFSRAVRGRAIGAEDPPRASLPEVYPEMTFSPQAPPVTTQFRYRPTTGATGSTPRSGWDVAWIRPSTGDFRGRSAVARVLDSWYPPVFLRSMRRYLQGHDQVLRVPPSTALLNASITFPAPDAAYERGTHVLLANRLTAADEGHHHEHSEVWSERGELLLAARLLRRYHSAR
jgi:hypothetical protein